MAGVYYSSASGAGRRRVSGAIEWRDVTNARDEDGLLIAVRRGKTNPDGETAKRYATSKGDVSRVLALGNIHVAISRRLVAV